MSPIGFGFLPFFIVIFTVLVVLLLVVGGVIGLRRSRAGLFQTIRAAAIVTGVLLLLGLGFSMYAAGRAFTVVPAFFILMGIFSFIVWVATLVDCAVNEPSEGNDKIVWVIIIVFTHIVGAVLYLVVRRPQRIAETGR